MRQFYYNMHAYTLKEIASVTGGKLSGNEQEPIRQLIIDSRTGHISDNSLFFAIKGENHDGHNFIPELATKGISGFVVSKMPDRTTSLLPILYLLMTHFVLYNK